MQYRKAGRSMSNGHCVEVMERDGTVYVRDSKNPDKPPLEFTPEEWRAFSGGMADGNFSDIGTSEQWAGGRHMSISSGMRA